MISSSPGPACAGVVAAAEILESSRPRDPVADRLTHQLRGRLIVVEGSARCEVALGVLDLDRVRVGVLDGVMNQPLEDKGFHPQPVAIDGGVGVNAPMPGPAENVRDHVARLVRERLRQVIGERVGVAPRLSRARLEVANEPVPYAIL